MQSHLQACVSQMQVNSVFCCTTCLPRSCVRWCPMWLLMYVIQLVGQCIAGSSQSEWATIDSGHAFVNICVWHWSQNFCKYCKDDPIQSWKNPRTLTNFMIGWCFRCSKTWHLWGDVNVYGWHGMMLPNLRRLRSKSYRNHQPSSWTCPCSTCSNYIILHHITIYYIYSI